MCLPQRVHVIPSMEVRTLDLSPEVMRMLAVILCGVNYGNQRTGESP